ncbi:MAG: DUF6448 family protein [Ignavibacteriales bacterium]
MKSQKAHVSYFIFTVLFLAVLMTGDLSAHCDGVDGPVVNAARKALKTNNINFILIWVQKPDEPRIREVFSDVMEVRKLNEKARNLADTYLFETLVRIHRAGEGEPYTGLKQAGRDLGPVIPAADIAIEKGNIDPLLKAFEGKEIPVAQVKQHFNEVLKRRNYDINDVEAGRDYVKHYVEFLHHAEELYDGHHEGS